MALTLSNTSIYQGGTTVDDSENLFVDYFRVAQYMRRDPWAYPGLNDGFVGLGSPEPGLTTFEKFPFAAATTNAIPAGNFTRGADQSSAGTNSETHGYSMGGGNAPTPIASRNVIDRFPFAVTPVTAVDVGDLTSGRFQGQTPNSSITHGYISGGLVSPVSPTTGRTNIIERWPFASAVTNAAQVGTLRNVTAGGGGHSTPTDGYSSGGSSSGGVGLTAVDRWPFASSTVISALVGNLDQYRAGGGCTSDTHGYVIGGTFPPQNPTRVVRFPFASTGYVAVNVGNLSVAKIECSSMSSTSHGYTATGRTSPSNLNTTLVIDRFPFAIATTNATNIGNVVAGRSEMLSLHW